MESTTELLERLCQAFPEVPTDLVQYYVNKYPKDEQVCIDVLTHQSQLYQQTSLHQGLITSQNQLYSLEIDKEEAAKPENQERTLSDSPPSRNSRSISDVGLPITQRPSKSNIPISRAQTAPTLSANFYGFSYRYPLLAYPDNGLNNNSLENQHLQFQHQYDNMMLHLPVTTPESIPEETSPRIDIPHANALNFEPDSNNLNSTKSSVSPTPKSNTSSTPELPPRPTFMYQPLPVSAGFVWLSPTSPVSNAYTSNNRTLSPNARSPAVLQNPRSPILPRNLRSSLQQQQEDLVDTNAKQYNTQLHIDIDPRNGNEWYPPQCYSPASNYHMLPQPIYIVNPSFGVPQVSVNQRVSPQPMPPNLHMTTWNQDGVQVIPVQCFNPPYFPMPTSSPSMYSTMDIPNHLRQQRQVLNSLRYEVTNLRIKRTMLNDDIKSLEQKLDGPSALPNKNEIILLTSENSKLQSECFNLCVQVDMHFKGDARLGEINEDFYTGLNTGQEVPPSPTSKNKDSPEVHHKDHILSEDEENKESSKWKCAKCTFDNHPAISICEICQTLRSP